jgi:acyl carrier protein
MKSMSTNDIVREFISQEILHGTRGTPLGDVEPLVESGIIDSLGIMSLLSFLEEKFSIQVLGDDLIPENFESVSTIVDLIKRYQSS